MNLKSFLKRFFWGSEVIEKVDSPINGKIEVREGLWNGKEVVVGGVAQSGGLVDELWRQVFNKQFSIFNILILGLGCGTLAQIISKKFPKAEITGVEIDPKVIDLGKKYFDLDKIPNLKIIVGDAFTEIAKPSLSREGRVSFDLIIVDLYLGQEFPVKAESEEFSMSLKKLLADKGQVIFNRLYYNFSHKQRANAFKEKLKFFFPKLKAEEIATNLVIFASLEAKNEI